jgi:hypothetical protein
MVLPSKNIYYEFSVYLDSAKPKEFPHIGDKFEIVKMEDMKDPYRGPYILVTLEPVENENQYARSDEILGEYNRD